MRNINIYAYMTMFRLFIPLLILKLVLQMNIYGQTISGTIISEYGRPLVGVSIINLQTTNGTVTDYKGEYSITLDSNFKTLRYCYFGFESQDYIILKDTIINVTLKKETFVLNEIITVR